MKIKKYMYGMLCMFLTGLFCACGLKLKNASDHSALGRNETAEPPGTGNGDIEKTDNQQDKMAEESDYRAADEIAETNTELLYDGVYPEHEPYGTGIGAMPGSAL